VTGVQTCALPISDPDAYLALLHALLRAGKRAHLTEAIEEPPAAADLVEIAMLRAAWARGEDDGPGELSAWDEALNHAALDTSRNRFLEIANYAGSLGATRAADDAWVAAIRIGWGPIPPYSDLLPLFTRLALQGRSEDLLAVYRTLLRFEPHNADLINNFYYLGVIHGLVEPGRAIPALEALIAGHPDRPEFHSVLAVARLAAGEPAAALAVVPIVRESPAVPPMMADAIEGCARVLDEQIDPGRERLAKVNWRAFMRQERAFFRGLLQSYEAEQLPLPEMVAREIDDSDTPAWRQAVERLEKARADDVLPPLPPVVMPAAPELPAD